MVGFRQNPDYNLNIYKNLSESMPNESTENFPLRRNLKLGIFHVGSAMWDVLATGVWNRIMISELGYAATPVGLLLALRYFLAPLAVWAGVRSDSTNWRGYRRLPWVWAGRLSMLLGFLIIAFSTVELVNHGDLWWAGIALGFVAASIGYSISGSTFLALVYDRAADSQRGRAVGIVWTFLLAGYAVAGVMFGRLLPDYSESGFLRFSVGVSVIILLIWLFALWSEEKPSTQQRSSRTPDLHLKADLKALFSQRTPRLLGIFMLLSFVGAFMQDPILEPFGGDVFKLNVGETSRFQAYWGTMAILSSMAALWGYRRFQAWGYERLARWGVVLLAITFIGLMVTALTARESMLRSWLIFLGMAYGLWNIGTLGLMVQNSREQMAGLDLGVWTTVVTLCRGLAYFLGGLLFDVFSAGFGDVATAYALVFALEAVLLVASLAVLNRFSVSQPKLKTDTQESELILSTSLE
jgi:MFS transporter, BCD family, chlorophyll transporter